MDFNAALEVKRRVEGLVHELLDVLLVDPRCPQPNFDLGSVQVLGLGGSQGFRRKPEPRKVRSSRKS